MSNTPPKRFLSASDIGDLAEDDIEDLVVAVSATQGLAAGSVLGAVLGLPALGGQHAWQRGQVSALGPVRGRVLWLVALGFRFSFAFQLLHLLLVLLVGVFLNIFSFLCLSLYRVNNITFDIGGIVSVFFIYTCFLRVL